MSLSLRFNENYLNAFGHNWRRFMWFGVALVILGLFAIFAAEFTTLLSVMLIGFVIFLSGAVIFFDTFSFWWKKWGGFFMHLIIALLYLTAGLFLMKNPVISSITLIYILGVIYIALGIIRIILAPTMQNPRWGWSFLNGLITLALGSMIFLSLPSSGLFILGLFIGIDLVFLGWNYIMMGMAAKELA